jgi:hypothetical protein
MLKESQGVELERQVGFVRRVLLLSGFEQRVEGLPQDGRRAGLERQ